MITQLLLDWLASAIGWLLGLLPEWSGPDPTTGASSIATVFQLTGWLNQYFPLDLTLTLLFAAVVWYAALWTVRCVLWCLTKLHIAGGSDS